MQGHPFLPAPGARLTPLPALCQAAPAPTGALGHCQPCSPPARLCGQAGQPAWEARPVSDRISPGALRLRCFLQAPMPSHTHSPPVLWGNAKGCEGRWGSVGETPALQAGSAGSWAPLSRGRAGEAEQNPWRKALLSACLQRVKQLAQTTPEPRSALPPPSPSPSEGRAGAKVGTC